MKIAIVTGAASGIGLGIAKALLAQDYAVATMSRRSVDCYPEFHSLLQRHSGRMLYVQGDVSSAENREALLAEVLARWGRVDLLVNNAGVAPKERRDLLDMTEESFDYVVNINTKATFFFSQLVARQMLRQEISERFRGIIINIGSVSDAMVSTNRGEYCISKAGISMITQLLAARLSGEDIMVYGIRPGVIRTPMTAGVTEKYDHLVESGAFLQKRWGTPEDLGNAVLLLAGGLLGYSPGQVLTVDGGLSLPRL